MRQGHLPGLHGAHSRGPATFPGKFQYLVDGRHKVYGADTAASGALPENPAAASTS